MAVVQRFTAGSGDHGPQRSDRHTGSALDVALEARRIEVEHIGLNCGIMDQYASVMGAAGSALKLDCQALSHDIVSLNTGAAQLWAVDSKAPRKLAGGIYNQRVDECRQIQQLAQSDDFFQMRVDLPDPLNRRLKHIQSEQQRVLDTVEAAAQGDLVRWGQLMNESHRSLSQDYEVAGPALDQLQAVLTEHSYGARMTGGGFGGCVIALIDESQLESAKTAVAAHYGDTLWIPCTPSQGARLLSVDSA